MLPFFSPLSNQIQSQAQAPQVDPSLRQVAVFNQSQFPTAPGVNFGIPNSNFNGFSASNAPAGLPPIPMASSSILGCPNVLPMMQNNQAGFFPHQNAPFAGAPQNLNQQLLGLQLLGQSCGVPQNVHQFQGQLQGFNILGSLLANTLPQNFNFVGGLPNGQMCLPTMMTQGNQIGVLNSPAQPCLGSNRPEIVGNSLVHSTGNKNTSFHKSALPTEGTNNSFSHDDRHGYLASKKLHQPMSRSPMKNHHSMKHKQPGDFRPQVSGDGGNDNSLRNSPRNFRGRGKTEQRRFQKPHIQNFNGMKSNTRRFNGAGGRGQKNWRGEPRFSEFSKPFLAENRRRPSLSYSETEIHQWIEARKKNYPTKANVQKKLARSVNEDADGDVKLRREQLKEVLAKQAELGVEVAEIPPGYLSDPEKQPLREENDPRACNTLDHFSNKHNHKRGRHSQDRWKTKRPKFRNDSSDTSVPFAKRREQTLLQKLLSTDIKRDNCRLLQILRFTVLNSFFDHWPEKPLEFPSITVKDMQCESGTASEKTSDPTCSAKMKFDEGKSSLVKEVVEGAKAPWNADDDGSGSESEPNNSNNSEMDCSMITDEHA